jgi:glutamine synthetase
MVGSSQSISNANIYLNTAMASVLEEIADRLEKATDIDIESHCIIKEFYKNHKRVIFNGNGYDAAWEAEAKKRGLPNFSDTVSALPEMLSEKSLHLLASQKVLSRSEVQSRVEISLQTYSKQVNVEAAIMVEMCRKYVIPSVTRYLGILSESIAHQEAIGLEAIEQRKIATTLSSTLNKSIAVTEELHVSIAKALSFKEEVLKQAQLYRDEVSNQMLTLRSHVDVMETYTDKGIWPFPSYDDLLFRL